MEGICRRSSFWARRHFILRIARRRKGGNPIVEHTAYVDETGSVERLIQDEPLSKRDGFSVEFHEFPAIFFAVDALDEGLWDVFIFDGEGFDDARGLNFEADVEFIDVHRAIFCFAAVAFLNGTRDRAKTEFEAILHCSGFFDFRTVEGMGAGEILFLERNFCASVSAESGLVGIGLRGFIVWLSVIRSRRVLNGLRVILRRLCAVLIGFDAVDLVDGDLVFIFDFWFSGFLNARRFIGVYVEDFEVVGRDHLFDIGVANRLSGNGVEGSRGACYRGDVIIVIVATAVTDGCEVSGNADDGADEGDDYRKSFIFLSFVGTRHFRVMPQVDELRSLGNRFGFRWGFLRHDCLEELLTAYFGFIGVGM